MHPGGLARGARPTAARRQVHRAQPAPERLGVRGDLRGHRGGPARAFGWVVLDDSGDPARPSSSWRYRIDPLPGGGSRVRQRFTHGPGASFLRAVAAEAPDQAAEIIAARRDGLRANMTATLRAMKAAAESSHPTGADPG